MPPLRTFMSRVMSRYPAEGIEPSPERGIKLEPVKVRGHNLYWIDEMLEGGLEIPQDLWDTYFGSPSFILLLSGAPGTGKTTFALELCYQLARHHQPYNDMPWSSLYVSAETRGNRLLENAGRFGWNRSFFRVLNSDALAWHWPLCNILGAENFPGTPSVFFQNFSHLYQQLTPQLTPMGKARSPLAEFYERVINGLPGGMLLPPDVVVIDSLNLFWPQQPDPANPLLVPTHGPMIAQAPQYSVLDAFTRLRNCIGGGEVGANRPKLLIFIVDSARNEPTHNPWEFLADAEIRFGAGEGPEHYHLRSFQIGKIKTQTHALGNNHVFKVVPGERCTPGPIVVCPQRTRGIPYLPTGGSYVFPSVHWHLSRSIRDDPFPDFLPPAAYSTGLPTLDAIMGGGFPSTHTSALVGRRGGMKSHLSYHCMLTHAIGDTPTGCQPKNVLLVSLRDDVSAARETLTQVLRQQRFSADLPSSQRLLNALLEEDRLEILYNWPGCITPDEFFHRLYVALARTRQGRPLASNLGDHGRGPGKIRLPCDDQIPVRNTAEVVVLNGLDHLDVKFPLCAAERVFVPALISLFRCFKVCSVVISGEDRVGSSHDIRPLSDLILEFSGAGPNSHRRASVPPSITQSSRVTALRVPAGQIGGCRGVLGRERNGLMQFFAEL